MIYLLLSSGLFLGWSLGANDAANVFGTAVGTKMIKFKAAAWIAAIFLILGAVIEGSGASSTLGKLGSINTMPGAFTVALAAALTVAFMTKLKLPVSTSQAIVGAIIGWNMFSGSLTDMTSLTKIVLTWILCPVLSALIAIVLYRFFKFFLAKARIHLLDLDAYTRIGLIIACAFGSYSLGANNIGNVMGVFTFSSPFHDINVYNLFTISGNQILFLFGGVAIAIGVFTYSQKVIKTVGKSLFKLSPVTAFIVVLSQSIVLYLFASTEIRNAFMSLGLPKYPLVPVSSSQAVIGSILGIAIAKGGRNIQFNILGRISSGWVTTPIIAGIISFVALFFVQNVFDQQVYHKVSYSFSHKVIQKLEEEQFPVEKIVCFEGTSFSTGLRLQQALNKIKDLSKNEKGMVYSYTEIDSFYIDPVYFKEIESEKILTREQFKSLETLSKQSFSHEWEFQDELISLSTDWKYRTERQKNHLSYNKHLKKQYNFIFHFFRKYQTH
ncbi:MAG: inorganic phosphate transporter [Candidatus Cloacimonas sp. 4484_140]|nr:MAG: inorganic phosphate transporter [Candidatus Cloacimonas sp. 4484_140]